jgi:hypothetical protein
MPRQAKKTETVSESVGVDSQVPPPTTKVVKKRKPATPAASATPTPAATPAPPAPKVTKPRTSTSKRLKTPSVPITIPAPEVVEQEPVVNEEREEVVETLGEATVDTQPLEVEVTVTSEQNEDIQTKPNDFFCTPAKRFKKGWDPVVSTTASISACDSSVITDETAAISEAKQSPKQTQTQMETLGELIEDDIEEQNLVQQVSENLDLNRHYDIPQNVLSADSEQTNPSDFYLYYNLEKQAASVATIKLEHKEIEQFIKMIKTIDQEGMRIMFVIIRMFALKQKQSKLFDLPYSGKVVTQQQNNLDIEFDLKNFPAILQRMIYLFAQKHLENQTMYSSRVVF